jgi:hypothetical protein
MVISPLAAVRRVAASIAEVAVYVKSPDWLRVLEPGAIVMPPPPAVSKTFALVVVTIADCVISPLAEMLTEPERLVIGP